MASLRFLLQKTFCLGIHVPRSCVLSFLESTSAAVMPKRNNANITSPVGNLVANLRHKVQRSSQLKIIPYKPSAVHESYGGDKHVIVNERGDFKLGVASGKEDLVCDARIRELINKREFDSIIPELEKYYDLDCYPSRKTLEILASAYSKECNKDGVFYIRQFCAKVYPKEYLWMMGYEHYLAEVEWKVGRYKESVELFLKLFKKYPLRRRKICNMTNFLMRHLLHNSLEDEYQHLTYFTQECAALNNFEVACNLWRASFVSSSVKGQQIALDLMKQYPQLSVYVPSKFNNLIEIAYERNDIDILQRLVQTVLAAQLKNSYTLVLGALLNFQCEMEDFNGAMETFQYSSNEKVVLPANTVHLFMALLSQQKKKVPSILLDSKYKLQGNERLIFKW